MLGATIRNRVSEMAEPEAPHRDQPIVVADDGAVRHVQLNRPHVLNALNGDLIHGLHEAIPRQGEDRWIVVLSGAGRAFCAGGDRRDGIAVDGDTHAALELLQGITRLLSSADVISIAAVHGWVVGGGLELALACDLVIAADDARFRLPDTAIGAHMTGGSTWFLPRTVGRSRALTLSLGLATLDATEAERWGLLTEVTPAGESLTRALDLANAVSQLPRDAVAAGKRSLTRALSSDLEAALKAEVAETEPLLARHDFSHGLDARAGQ
jgi:enoyl-CoA hydratase/carnithine racemase